MNSLTQKTQRLAARSAFPFVALLLAGCSAALSPDSGMGRVSSEVTSELTFASTKVVSEADETTARHQVDALLTGTLSAEQAVRLALLNNRGLQAEYNQLGISEADYVEASSLPNPVVSIGKILAGDELEIETRLVGSLLSVFTLGSRTAAAKLDFEAAQLRAVQATFNLAANTRRAYYTAVASRQAEAFLEQARESARLTSEFTVKLGETGAATKIDQARASAVYLETSNRLAEARLKSELDREALVRLLGLWGRDINFKLPSALPQIPDKLPKSADTEALAIGKRVDLRIAKLELDALAKKLRLTKATRFVPMLDLAGLTTYVAAGEGDEKTETRGYGFELEFELPVFDSGAAETWRASEQYMQAVNRLAERAVNIRSEVRAAYQSYRATYDITWQFRNRILPMRAVITEQSLLEYNGMLTDVFDLLTTAQENANANIAAIEAKRNFFLATVDFQSAIIGGGSSGPAETTTAAAAPAGAEH
ncbi:TolC family protein [Devosia sp.]|uniref:TolC family protein n=2 Tax=unclassified Devosia TaxID=196773 RepID=UPI00086A9CFA|nr:TolC family protein [Devosia sp.]ODS87919.1 MAG: copper resistance protein [Devosia sp. SCN 66-27]